MMEKLLSAPSAFTLSSVFTVQILLNMFKTKKIESRHDLDLPQDTNKTTSSAKKEQ